MNNIIGYVKEIIGNFTATNNVDGSVRELKLNDPIYEDEFVIGEDSDAKIVIGFNDNLQEIILAGNDGLLFDAALLDAKFNATEQNNDGQEENEDEVDEDEIDEPGAGEEDLENENGDTGEVADRTGGATNVNSDLRTAAFTRQEPEPLEENNEKLESHASFSIAHPTSPTTSDNAVFTPTDPVITPVSPPIIINTPPPIIIPPLPPVIKLPVLINDSPEAVEDFNNITEDSQSNTIVGDVFKNDDIGNNIAEFPVTSVNGTAAGAEVEGEYGIIVINRDGSYSYQLFNENLAIQALTTNESLTDVFTYTITDFDGDTATTTLTIIIAGSDDGVTLTIPDNIGAVGGAEEQVFEHGLTDGSNPNNDDVVKSSFTLKALDGLDSITVGGTDISEQDLADSGTTPITLTTAIGSVLVLNGYAMAADGTITLDYTYTLAAEQNHSAGTVNDEISIVVTDTDGDSTTDVLTITIVDDVPTATSDSNALNEDSISVSANVFINDTLGADQTLTPVTGVVAGQSNTDAQGQVNSTVTGSYGDVVVQAGGSYTYQLDNSHLAVQSLTSGESLTDIFTYTITDSDGDTATTTLTITIAGTDDGAILSIPEQQVFERGLETGSTPNNDDVVNSSFTLTTLDGLDNISLNGTDISVQDLADSATTPITLTTAIDSILVLNGYAMAADGTITVNYTYTLTKTQDHSASTVNDDISIVVTDTDGDSTTDVLTITIVDDVPTATSDSNALNEDGTSISVTANVFINDTLGADKTLTPVTGVIAGPSNVAVQGDVNTTVTGSYGEVVVQADGSYTYQLDNSHLAVQSLANSESLTDIFTYTITDSDGDTATTTLTITIAGTDDGVTLTIPDNVGVAGGAEEQVFEHGLTDGSNPNNDDVVNSSFTLKALDGLDNISLNGTDISAQDLADSASTPIMLTTAIGSALVLNGYAMAADGTITIDYTYTLTAEQNHSAGTVNDDISIVVTDTDGDSTTDVLTITIVDDVPTATSDSNALNEDGTSISVTANVFTNDTLGADQTLTPITGVVAGQSNIDVQGQVNTTVTGSYGNVQVQADGSYVYQLENSHLAVQSLTSGESLTDIFTYTITDSDGDTATTNLTITIAGTDDGVTLTIPDNVGVAGGAEEQVFERGLDAGSTPNNEDIVNSSFTLTALDGLKEITVGGTVISASALAAITSSTPITVTTAIGSLVLNGYAIATDGTITVNYTYTLGDNQDHSTSSVSDDITLVVTDTDGDNTTDVLNISIVDDAPTAVSDINTIAEDISSISANVFTDNDTLGADQTVTPVTGIVAGSSITAVVGQVNTTVTGSYGNVQVQADGSYVYQLDNSNLDVQTLTTSELLTDIFTYTITDSDGDTATTTLTITIAGTDDGVTLTIPDNVGVAGGSDEQVFERGLETGSTPNDDDVVTSTFTLKALDGLKEITVGGTVISATALEVSASTPITLTTVKGSLEINGYAMATDGTITVDYTYTLTAEQDHSAGAVNDDFTIMVTDTDGGNTTDVLTINIVDDAPIANDDITRNVTEGGISINGNVIDNTTDNSGDDVFSADTTHQIGSFTYTNEMGNIVAGVLGTSVDTQYGSLTLNSDGSWVYISDNTEDQSITDPISEQFTYTLTDNDGSSDTAVQVITVSDGIDPSINNAENPLVIVYEGSSAVTFDGADNYNESQSNAAQDTASTLTHKLDFTAGDDNAGIVSFSFDGTTKVITLGGSATITDNDKGSLTVHYNGTWTYTAPSTYVHDTANGVNNFQSTFTYVVSDTDGDTVTNGSQTIQIDDTLPTVTSDAMSVIEEKHLPTGSDPDSGKVVTTTGTIVATQESGAVDIQFSATTLTSLDNLGLLSGGDSISYSINSDSGGNSHILTAYTNVANINDSKVFTVTISDAVNTTGTQNVGYTVTWLKPLDHVSNEFITNGIVMNLPITILDDDGDSAPSAITIKIIDDAPPTNQAMTVDEDSNAGVGANTITTHADATQANTTISTPATYGSAEINADGTLTYTPNGNFSGGDTVIYETTHDDSTTSFTTVMITVTPIADAPTNLVDSTSLQTQEDTVVALGLNAPTQTDSTDASGNGDNIDNPELYGVITLSGIPSDATLSYGSTSYTTANSAITIMLSDGDHVTGTLGDLTMTIAEYESMQIIPPLDSGDNITITVNVSSYEVNDDGSVIVGINPATATATIDIDVQAVTDPVTLTYTGAASLTIDEDTSFDLSTLLTETFGDKLDGSETFTYELTGVPVGTELTINGTSAQAPANGIVSVNFTGDSPTVILTPPKDFSGDIGTITITLKAVDSDSDSTDAAPSIATESASVILDLHVDPIANDVAIGPVSVAEDTPVAFLANLRITDENNDLIVGDNDDDGNDRITEITIGNLDNGFELTTANGTVFYTSTSDDSEFIITIDTATVASTGPNTGTFTIADATAIKLDSHRPHSSLDIPLDITVKAIDSQHVNTNDVDSIESTTLFTAATSNPLIIKVTAVSETKLSDSDGANGNDVTSQGDHTYVTPVAEDSGWIVLHTDNAFVLEVTNEDDEHSGIAGASNSEITMINFSNVPVGSQFTIDGGATVLTVTDSAVGVDIPLADLGTLQFMPTAQFSGTIEIHMAVKTTDKDEDDNATSTMAISSPDILTLVIDPLADNVTLAIKQASGNEDAGRSDGNTSNIAIDASAINNAANGIALDITTTTDDTDGSESFVVTISGIPDEGEIYYDGTLMNINSGTSGDLTATDANNADGTWTIQIESFNNDATLTFIPPHNDDSNYTFDVSAYSVDGAENTQASPQTLTIDIDVKGVADIPNNTELNGFNADGSINDAAGVFNYVTTEATLDGGTNQFDFRDVYQTPNILNSYDDDDSESLTIIITGLDSQFSIDNATFIGGTGTSRQWVFQVNDLANIKVNTPINFSGEIDLTVKYITTEGEGDSATHPAEDIKVLVTPSAEATLNSGTTISEDQLTLLDFSIQYQQGDTDETLEIIRINKTDVAAGDFTLYFGNSTAVTLDDAAASNANISDNGTHYILTNNTFNNIYALGSADLHSSNSFDVIYDIKDSVSITGGESAGTISGTLAYNFGVNAITDDITVSLDTITGGVNGTVLGNTITVTDNTTINVNVNVMGSDNLAEGNTGTGNGADKDGSEQVTRFVIENVSLGITVVGGIYAGDIYNANTTQYENSGIWYLDVNEALDGDGVNRTITFNIDGNTNSFDTSTVKITAYNEDDNNTVRQNDFTTFTIIKDGSYNGTNQTGIPATILDFSVNSINIIEDSSFTLDDAISATITGSSAFAIVLTNLLAGSTVTGAQEQGDTWIVYGNGDSAAVLAAMQAVIITPPENFNSFDNADSDTFVFNATMTTYEAFSQANSELSFDKPVYPLTDDLTIGVTQNGVVTNTGTTTEDNSQAFTLTLSNPADGGNTVIIDGKLYLKVTENYTDTGTAVGTLTDGSGNVLVAETLHAGNNSAGLVGNYYVISGVSYSDILDFIYTPGENRQGSVEVDVYTQNQETHGWSGDYPSINGNTDTAINLSTQQFSFNITPIIDGTNITAINVSGTEDVVIAGGVNRVALDLSLSSNDPSETVVTALLDNVPVGFLVYYQDPSNASNILLAQNAGISTAGFNQWAIPLNNGALPAEVYIQAPEHWSGALTGIEFTSYSSEEHLSDLSANNTTFDLTINAVADGLTLNATKVFGNEGDDISLNLNANVIDLDGSETVTITLKGLGVDANFKANSQDINDSSISYNSGSDTYTINDIATADINNLSFIQQSFTGTINVTAQTVESNNNNTSVIVNDSFTAQISEVNATSVDDTLFYKQGNNVDALTGHDTLILSNDVGIDFSSLTNADGIENIELIDLQQNGNHNLEKLSLQDVIDMTDSDNDLIIQGDTNDSTSFTDNNGWVKGGGISEGGHDFDLYTNTNDATVSVKVEQDIDTIIY
jgi:VCBS repeat-containing protein